MSKTKTTVKKPTKTKSPGENQKSQSLGLKPKILPQRLVKLVVIFDRVVSVFFWFSLCVLDIHYASQVTKQLGMSLCF